VAVVVDRVVLAVQQLTELREVVEQVFVQLLPEQEFFTLVAEAEVLKLTAVVSLVVWGAQVVVPQV